jgi:pimeloyl-ACP methyl ester carboxylesterase
MRGVAHAPQLIAVLVRLEGCNVSVSGSDLPRPDGGATDHRVTTVIVPGLGLRAPAYEHTLRHVLGPSHVVPLPSLGLPAAPGSDLSAEAQAVRLLGVLAARGATRVVLVGHSASCPVVVEAARRDPGLVKALVLIGPTIDPRSRTWPRMIQRWVRTAFWERPRYAPLLARLYAGTGVRSMIRGMDAVRHHELGPALARTSVPALIVRGRHDRIAPADWLQDLRETSHVEIETLSGGAHMIVLTHGAELAGHLNAAGDGVALTRAPVDTR